MPRLPQDRLDRLFGALADATRRDVVMRLAHGRDAAVSDLARAYAMALPSFTQHLRVLEDVGLLTSVRAGNRRHVALRPDGFAPVLAWIAGVAAPAAPAAAARPGAGLAGEAMAGGAAVAEASPTAGGGASPLRRATAFAAEIAPVMAVVELALAPGAEPGPAAGASPRELAAGLLAALAARSPALREELAGACTVYRRLLVQIAAVEHGAPDDELKAASLALSRSMYHWRADPPLRRVFGLVAA